MLARLVPEPEPEPENIYDSGAIAVYIMIKLATLPKSSLVMFTLASKTHTSEYLLKPFASEQLF